MPDQPSVLEIIEMSCGIPRDEWPADPSHMDLGIDSLVLSSIISHCEMHCIARFDDKSIAMIMGSQSVGDLVRLVESCSLPPKGDRTLL